MPVTVVRWRGVPPRVHERSGFGHDYVDLFVANVPGADTVDAEVWARATCEGAPAAGRFLAWQTALALRLDHEPSPDRVVGWRIGARGPGWIRLEAESWHLAARMLFMTEGDHVLFATFLRYDRTPARAVWGALSVVHRAAAPGFLGGGVKRARSRIR